MLGDVAFNLPVGALQETHMQAARLVLQQYDVLLQLSALPEVTRLGFTFGMAWQVNTSTTPSCFFFPKRFASSPRSSLAENIWLLVTCHNFFQGRLVRVEHNAFAKQAKLRLHTAVPARL